MADFLDYKPPRPRLKRWHVAFFIVFVGLSLILGLRAFSYFIHHYVLFT